MEANGRCAGNFLLCVEVTWLVIRLNYERLLAFSTLFGLAAACLFAPAATESMRSPAAGATAVSQPSAAPCSPLPPPTGPTITVTTEADLRYQAQHAAPGTTILVAPGTYNLQDAVYVTVNNLTIRGATGNRGDVILDGGGMLTWTHTHIIAIFADDVTIADLTLRNGDEHGVSVNGSDRPILYNLHILDTGYQLVKVNPVGDGSEDGLLACSRLEYTTTSPEDYTHGISAHNAHRWTVRDNEWRRIRTPNQVPAPAILFWSGSSDTIVERNLLVDCYQGIAFGNASHDAGDHTGGIVRNNMIYASLPHDSVIEMVHASGWLVAHNTALLLNPDGGLTWGMEARFSDSSGTFAYNLTNMDIWLDRDGATGSGVGNVTDAQSDWFVAAADLHLAAGTTAVIDQAAPLAAVPDDYDGFPRPYGPAPDIGADEYVPPFIPSHFLYLPWGGGGGGGGGGGTPLHPRPVITALKAQGTLPHMVQISKRSAPAFFGMKGA
ncbi:MAG: right-handed parallel beta-helix repeat-containing protein [Chloroflexi bacterium]|nr:right-handed parallel beta-helix repeat-containing protein [Chloroflexota bacterium]